MIKKIVAVPKSRCEKSTILAATSIMNVGTKMTELFFFKAQLSAKKAER